MLFRLLVAAFCLLLMAFAFVARKPLCVDSNLVDRIDRIDEKSPSSMFRCGLHRHVPYDEKFAEESPLLSRRLRTLESFFSWAGPLHRGINLTVTEQRPSVFRVYDHEIYMGSAISKVNGQIERGVIKVWLRERANKAILERSLLEEVFTDFFSFVAMGQLQIEEPQVGIAKEVPDSLIGRTLSAFKNPPAVSNAFSAKWPRVLQTMTGYCKSPWRYLEHVQFCQQMSDSPKGAQTQLTVASLRPLLSTAMIEAMQRLNSEQQFRLVKKMVEFLNVFYFRDTPPMRTLQDGDEQSYEEASRFVISFIEALKNWKADEFIFTRFAENFQSVLEERGFFEFGESSTVQFYVFGDAVRPEHLTNLYGYVAKNPQAIVAVEQGNDLVLLPNLDPIPKSAFGFIKGLKAIWLRCQLPTSQEVVKLANRFQRLLVVDMCNTDRELDLASYVRGGATEFARKNKEMAFVHIHTKSFALAVERNANPYGWTKLHFEKALHAYRAENVIPSIDYFRGRATRN